MARKQLGAAPSNAADTATKAYADGAVATITAAIGASGGIASLDNTGRVPTSQLPVTQAAWNTLDGKPAVVAAGATKAAARAAIDAIALSDITISNVDGGTPSSTSTDSIDGGTP